jgi:hypothetical protein
MDALIALSVIVLSGALIIWVIGAVMALSRWRPHPRVSLFALLAFGMLLVSRFQSLALPPIVRNYGWTEENIGPDIFPIVELINSLSSVVAWAFVLCAIFGWRDKPQKQNIPPPSPSTFGNEPSAQNTTL